MNSEKILIIKSNEFWKFILLVIILFLLNFLTEFPSEKIIEPKIELIKTTRKKTDVNENL